MTAPKRRPTGAVDQLHRALANLSARGQLTPCAEHRGWLWLADDAEDRAIARRLCNPCPVLAECHDAAEANNERFGVWAARDRTWPKHVGQADAA